MKRPRRSITIEADNTQTQHCIFANSAKFSMFFSAGPLVAGNLQHAPPSYLCFFQQVCEDREPVWNERLQLQSDDGQGQRGAFELPELVAGHTVLHLPSPQHRLEAQRRLLMPRTDGEQTGARCRVPDHACAKPDGQDEVRVAGDEQGVELDWGER